MMRYIAVFLFAGVLLAEIPERLQGDWVMVNGVLVLNVTADEMTLRNSGAVGPLVLKDKGEFTWSAPDGEQTGRFEDEILFLKGAPDAPKWVEYLEFRRASSEVAAEIIEFALRQQNQAMGAFERVRRSSQERAVMNNLRQLAAAADQYYLENGVDTTTYEKLVGQGSDKYIKSITSVDGEDYSKLEFKQGKGLTVTTDGGIEVSYDY